MTRPPSAIVALIAVLAALAIARPAATGAPISEERRAGLPGVCDGGDRHGQACQGGDSELADALRELYGVDGRPVIVNVSASPDTLVHTDEEATGCASAVQLLAAIRFVPEG
jgi:hypothetical protein